MKFTNQQLAYLVLRIATGMNFLVHGLARMGQVNEFAQNVASGFAGTSLNPKLALYYGFFIPYFELVIGLFIFLGLFMRQSLFLGGLFMATLILGKGLQHDWSVLGTQMIYVLVFYLLLKNLEHNVFTIRRK